MSAGRPAILALGSALPGRGFDQREIAEFMVAAHGLEGVQARRLRELYRLTQIERRHSVVSDYGRAVEEFTFFPRNRRLEPAPSTARRMQIFQAEAPRLALSAVHDLMASIPGFDPGEIVHLIVVSCTGASAPGIDTELTASIPLPEDVGRSVLGFQGCHGGLAALRLAGDIAAARPARAVLIACVELSTLHFQAGTEDENLVANAIFADGAAAALVAGPALAARWAGRRQFRLAGHRTVLRGAGREGMSWTVGDTGFELRLSRLLPRLVGTDLRASLAPILTGAERFWAVHPGGSAVLDAVERSLELGPGELARSRDVLRAHGNMSSPTIFFVLRELLRDPAVRGPGMALAFGPGLTIEAARLELAG